MAKKHDEIKDIALLSQKKGVTVDVARKEIRVNVNGNVGNGSWGRIDFLSHYCGYYVRKTNEALDVKKSDNEDNTTPVERKKKVLKHLKLNEVKDPIKRR